MAYRVLRPKAAPGRLRGIEGLQAEIVGRQAELAALRSVLKQLQQGVGHVVVVLAEAGLGKSRLIRETRHLFEECGGDPANWIAASSLSYESGQAYALMRQLLAGLAGISADDPPAAAAEKLAGLLAGTPEAEAPQSRQVLEVLLQLDGAAARPALEGEAFKRVLFRVMRAVWRQRFAERPGVVVADDLHWADPASVELLEHLLPLIDETPLLLILAMRPDREPAGWRLKTKAEDEYHHRATELNVRPLSEAESDELVNRLLAIADLPESLRARMRERAGGNPFFVEEVIRNLIESGAVVREERLEDGQARNYWRASGREAELQIPDNLQSLLTARIDRLEEHARHTVQLASVIGRSFYYKVLALLARDEALAGGELDRRLKTLLRAELIQEAARIPEVEYRFRNPLTQETAYQTILVKRRRELHRQVAEAFEALYPDRLVELTPRLSYHYREAQIADRALKYLVLAADAAYRLYAITEALRNYGEALALAGAAGAGSEQLRHIYLRRGRAMELAGQHEAAQANYTEMQAAAQARGDRGLELAAMAELAKLYTTPSPFFNLEAGERLITAGLALARELEDGALEAKLLWNMVNLHRFGNRHAEALAAGERSLALARELGLKEQLAYTLNDIFYVYLNAGRPGAAMESSVEARELWRELGNQAMLADNLSSVVLLKGLMGDLPGAISASEEAWAISRSIDNEWGLSFSQMNVGSVYWRQGQFDPAQAALKRAVEYGRAAGFTIATQWGNGELGMLYSLLGQTERGLEMARQALNESIAQYTQPALLPAYLAEIHLVRGELAEAEALVQEAIANPRILSIFKIFASGVRVKVLVAQGRYAEGVEAALAHLELLKASAIRALAPDTQLALGQAYQGLGQIEPARAAMQSAQMEAEAIGLNWYLWQVLAARAELEREADAAALAQEYLSHAQRIVERIAGDLSDLEQRAAFLARPVIRSLLPEPV